MSPRLYLNLASVSNTLYLHLPTLVIKILSHNDMSDTHVKVDSTEVVK